MLILFSLTLPSALNGPIMVGSTNPAHIIIVPPSCWILLATSTFEFNKKHLSAYPSGPSNVTWDLSVKITSEMSIFMYFLAQF